ncbi:MAG: hypothetical protein EPN99_15375 [Frankiales bacterium]|nr:MAG: hypothetical protein EPN99_15375 [Frankiales bacterium]
MRNALVRLSTVTLDMTDAIELSELLDYLAQWLELADDHVRADLTAFAWDEGAMPMVRERLVSFSRLLVFGHADFDLDDDSNLDGQEGSW